MTERIAESDAESGGLLTVPVTRAREVPIRSCAAGEAA